ncbi:MAG TPA: FKBP-type peptidyl-prolyl cis-trans isomerase [Myxococcota bacterium]
MGIQPRFRLSAFAAAGFLVLPWLGARAEEAPSDASKVADGKKVSIEYTLKLDDGTQADSNVGEQPLVYQQGANQILPALELALAGLAVNDTKHVTIAPKDGYGDIDPSNVKQVDIEEIPEAARKVDAVLIGVDADGNQVPVRVQKVEEKKVTLDLNHPLAGRTLTFDVKIVKIE